MVAPLFLRSEPTGNQAALVDTLRGCRHNSRESRVAAWEVRVNEKELHFLSVAEQAKLLRDGELSPVELTEAYLERVERLNSRLFAYITVTADMALEQARRAEGEIGRGEHRGPLHGIPIAVKDQMWTEGIRTTERVVSVAGLRAGGGRDGHRANQGSGGGAAGEAEHERIRFRRAVHVSLRADA